MAEDEPGVLTVVQRVLEELGYTVLVAGAPAACIDRSFVQPTANTLIVHAVLDPGTPDQYVIVQSTTGAIRSQAQVIGAVVTLTTPDGRALVADQIRDTTIATPNVGQPPITVVYRLSLGRAGVLLVPGGTYQLRVVVPDGRIVIGTTTLPGATPVTSPGSTSTIDRVRDTVSLAWPRVAGARSYEVSVRSPVSTFDTFADTSISLIGSVRDGNDNIAFSPGQTSTIVVSAVDANYYDYYRRESDVFTGSGVINHLQGGIGLFGAVVAIRTATVIVK